VAEPRAPAGEPGVAARLVELRLGEVGHVWVLSRGLARRPLARLRRCVASSVGACGAARPRPPALTMLGGA